MNTFFMWAEKKKNEDEGNISISQVWFAPEDIK